jgi:hypothetical protein
MRGTFRREVECRTLIDLGAPPPSTEKVEDPRWAKLRELDLGDDVVS